MLLGAHESTAGGLHEAWPRGASDGAEAVQIFTRSSRMWAAKPILPEDAAAFRAAAGPNLPSTSVHASYLINLGAPEGDLREKSIAAFADELYRCDALGIPFLVVHPGSNADSAAGCTAIAAGLDRAFALTPGPCQVLLETAAGQGSSLGRTFEELRAMREAVSPPNRDRVAICLDTCHVFASGYDLSTPEGYAGTFQRFDEVLGLGLLKAFHLNDSKKPLGCRVDRHEVPGTGCIGEGAFRLLVNDLRFQDVPGYLELPPEHNPACLSRLRSFRGKRELQVAARRPQTPPKAAPRGVQKTAKAAAKRPIPNKLGKVQPTPQSSGGRKRLVRIAKVRSDR